MLENNSLMDDVTPLQFRLSQNYPNPFTERTMIKYCIAYKTQVKLTVYSSERTEVRKLVDEEQQPGAYEVEFNIVETHLPAGGQGRDASLQSGTYFYRLEAGGFIITKIMEIEK
jgi:hypothetical protein